MPYINLIFFFFNDTATTQIYTLSLHDALPISAGTQPDRLDSDRHGAADARPRGRPHAARPRGERRVRAGGGGDRKSTRLNSSHTVISYAVFCLKKKKKKKATVTTLEIYFVVER